MTKKHWLILAAVAAALGVLGAAVVLALVLGFFAGHEEAAGPGPGLPVYTSAQSASTHTGYRHSALACGSDVYVNDYEEACLQLAYPEPQQFIGRIGTVGNARIGVIPAQATTAYVAGDVGSEMPAYIPYRHIKQPPFDWRTAAFREMTVCWPGRQNPYLTTTKAALLAEVVQVLRDGSPVELPGFPFVGITNLATIKMTCDQLPGLQFCPAVYIDRNGTIYLAESLMMDTASTPPQLHARWIPASPLLAEWLTAP